MSREWANDGVRIVPGHSMPGSVSPISPSVGARSRRTSVGRRYTVQGSRLAKIHRSVYEEEIRTPRASPSAVSPQKSTAPEDPALGNANIECIARFVRSLSPDGLARLAKDLSAIPADHEYRQLVRDIVAKTLRFRAITLDKMDQGRFAEQVKKTLLRADTTSLTHLVYTATKTVRAELAGKALSAFALSHCDLVPTSEPDAPPPTQDELALRLQGLRAEYPDEDVDLTLLALSELTPTRWQDRVGSLWNPLSAVDTEPNTQPAQIVHPEPLEASIEKTQVDPLGLDLPGFSTLDRAVIRSVISTLNEVEGSLDFDELDDLVQELVDLNDTRFQSRFHRGFLDALTNRPLASIGPGDNQVRREWYLCGHGSGVLRKSPQDFLSWVDGLNKSDLELLLRAHDHSAGAGAFIAVPVVRSLLEAGRPEDARPWIEHYLIGQAPQILQILNHWARVELLAGDPDTVRQVLAIADQAAEQIKANHPGIPDRILRDVRRRLSIAWRRVGRSDEALSIVDSLLELTLDSDERARLLGDRALLRLGIRDIEDLQLPPQESQDAFLSAIEDNRSTLEEADRECTVPVVAFMLALPAVARPGVAREVLESAIDRLRAALDLMVREDAAFWERTSLLRRVRLYLSVLELRSADEARSGAAGQRLLDALKACDEKDALLALEAIDSATTLGVRQAPDLAAMALSRWPGRTMRVLDLRALTAASPDFAHDVVAQMLNDGQALRIEERWKAWESILKGCIRGDHRNIECARTALDQLEILAYSSRRDVDFVKLIDDQQNWDPAWDMADAEQARSRILEQLGRLEDARAVLLRIAHAAISEGEDLIGVVELADRITRLGAPVEELAPLRGRIQAALGEPESTPAPKLRGSWIGVRVLFVGGNEKQRVYKQHLEAAVQGKYPGATVDFEFPGWSSNWARQFGNLKDRAGRAGSMVIMRFVRTNLGIAMRRVAGELDIPWVACSGHGRDSMERAICRAIELAASRRA